MREGIKIIEEMTETENRPISMADSHEYGDSLSVVSSLGDYNRARVVGRSASAFSKRSARRNTAHPLTDLLYKTSGSQRKHGGEVIFENEGIVLPYQTYRDKKQLASSKWNFDEKINKSFSDDIAIADSWVLWVSITIGLLCLGNAFIYVILSLSQLKSAAHCLIVMHYCLILTNMIFLFVAKKISDKRKTSFFLFCSGLSLLNSILSIGFSYHFFVLFFHSVKNGLGLTMASILYSFISAATLFLSYISFKVQFILTRIAFNDPVK